MRSKFENYDDLDPIRKALCSVKRSSNQDLARLLGWTDAKTSRTVDTLVDAGVLSKERDGKAVNITLPKGTEVYQHMFKPVGLVMPN